MKKIIVTGGCGFIGSELVKQLSDKKYDLTVADNLSKPESSIKEGYNFINIDLTNAKATDKLFSQGFDICLNLAAKIGGIGYFHKYPAMILSENNKLYSSIFEGALKNNIKRMVYVSSSMVFESTDHFPSKEEDLDKIPPPFSAYGFSKLIGEKYCEAFHKQYGLEYSICRPFNAYGINEYPGEETGYAHVIPDLVKKVLDGQYPLKLLGDGQQSRCFTHVKDLCDGIIKVVESEKAVNESFNISSPEETKMIDLARIIWKLCGKKEEDFKVEYVPGFKCDVKRRIPDVSKMEKMLGWVTKTKLKDGLLDVVEWLKKEYRK